MLEIIIDKQKNIKTIALVENGRLVEKYEETKDSNRNEGNIYVGKVKDILSGMQSAFIDIGTEKNSFIHLKDILPKVDEKKEEKLENVKIKNVIRTNDNLLVQVKKDSNDKKGARVSTHISLPSLYMVFMPNTDIITISQKIEDEKEKNRLLEIFKSNIPKGNGAIIRTSAAFKSKEELICDIKDIYSKWENILKQYEKNTQSPKLICKSETIINKMIIDLANKNLDSITTNDKEEYEQILVLQKNKKFIENLKVNFRENENLLDMYELQNQIDRLKNRKIWLNCGGFITIDKTEALTAIDINTGKYTGKKDLEETIYKVNEEATIEIAKQLRLRDIGGIIIIDYIDMKEDKNKESIINILKEELKKDRAKTQVEGFTKLDLMELTRKHICSHED